MTCIMKGVCLVAGLFVSGVLNAAPWVTLAEKGSDQAKGEVRAKSYHLLSADEGYLQQLYAGMSQIELPLPEGGTIMYVLTPYSLLPDDLARQYPQLLTFQGHQVDNPTAQGRFDIGPNGFYGVFVYNGRSVYLDTLGDGRYASYYQNDSRSNLEKKDEQIFLNPIVGRHSEQDIEEPAHKGKSIVKAYTIAISTTGEYTRFHGGTKEKALNAVMTLLNRLNQIYRRDLGVELKLASGNDNLIFTDPQTDPFTNSTWDMKTNASVQSLAKNNNLVGNFDVGHVLTTSGGGVAVLRSLGTASRSMGMTGSWNPTGDGFFVDYVAHELGHQFGADHTFNGTSGSCGGGNRNPKQAWEPGSGSSIMAYAGLCGEESIQSHSDPYFHSKSIEQIKAHLSLHSDIGTVIKSMNEEPVVNAGNDIVIPAMTPFTLTGAGSDPDGDELSYSWEQIDLGEPSMNSASMVDDGFRPLFRFMQPIKSPERTFPSMKSLVTGVLAKGEAWPELTRELNFRLTARDNRGGVASDDMKVKILSDARFSIYPMPGNHITAGQKNIVNWEVGSTDRPPISCSMVNISLSSNEGDSWRSIAPKQPNNGAASIFIPVDIGEAARIKISCADNIFFAMSSALTVSKTAQITTDNNESSIVNVNEDKSNGGGGGSLDWIALISILAGVLFRRLME